MAVAMVAVGMRCRGHQPFAACSRHQGRAGSTARGWTTSHTRGCGPTKGGTAPNHNCCHTGATTAATRRAITEHGTTGAGVGAGRRSRGRAHVGGSVGTCCWVLNTGRQGPGRRPCVSTQDRRGGCGNGCLHRVGPRQRHTTCTRGVPCPWWQQRGQVGRQGWGAGVGRELGRGQGQGPEVRHLPFVIVSGDGQRILVLHMHMGKLGH